MRYINKVIIIIVIIMMALTTFQTHRVTLAVGGPMPPGYAVETETF